MERFASWRSMYEDSRGILDPGRMQEVAQFRRYAPPPELDGLVNLLWSVTWELPDGQRHDQELLNHPCANVSVGHEKSQGVDSDAVVATVVGVPERRTARHLTGRGWNAAARLAPGAFGAFLTVDATELANRIVPAGTVLHFDEGDLVRRVSDAAPDIEAQVGLVAISLVEVLERAEPARVAAARETAAVAARAESDRSLRTAAELAAVCGFGVRTLQRLFRTHAGVSPAWMLRRYRLIEAAEAARHGDGVSWTDLAHELGYADQAHLTRDFKAAVGRTPSAYLREQTPLPAPADPT